MARDKKIPMTVHLPGDLVAELKTEQFGDTFSQVVTDRLRQALKMGDREAAPPSPTEALDLRKKVAEVEMIERRAAILRKEYIKKESAMNLLDGDYAIVKSRIYDIPNQIFNLTAEQHAEADRAVQDCLTDLSAESPATWDDLADDAAKELK